MSETMQYPYVYKEGTRDDDAPVDKFAIGTLEEVFVPMFEKWKTNYFHWINIEDNTKNGLRRIRIEVSHREPEDFEYLPTNADSDTVKYRRKMKAEMKEKYDYLQSVDKEKINYYHCESIHASTGYYHFILEFKVMKGE